MSYPQHEIRLRPLVISVLLLMCGVLCLAEEPAAPVTIAKPAAPIVNEFQPDAGFVALFDGKDLTGWYATHAMEEQQLKRPDAMEDLDGKIAMGSGRILSRDGTIVCGENGKGETGVFTKKEYRNYILRLQWKGIGGGYNGNFFDSGVWNRCGHCGHYTQFNISPMDGWDKNKEWQDEEIVAFGNSVTCRVNGRKIRPCNNAREAFPLRGPIGLQAETSTVIFRNIEIMELPDSTGSPGPEQGLAAVSSPVPTPVAAVLPAGPSASASAPSVVVQEFQPEEGFIALFNSKDLSGWNATRAMEEQQLKKPGAVEDLDGKTGMADGRIAVKEGVIVCGGNSQGEAGIFTKKAYRNYVLRLQWKGVFLDPVKNRWFDSGVWNRSGHCGHYTQFNIGPTEEWDKNKEWQDMAIVAIGNTVTCSLNGRRIMACDGWKAGFPAAGPIGLQAEASIVKFRNIEIMELPDSAGQQSAFSASAAASPRP